MIKHNHKYELRLTHKKDKHCCIKPQRNYYCSDNIFGEVFLFCSKDKAQKRLRCRKNDVVVDLIKDPYCDYIIPRMLKSGSYRLSDHHRTSVYGDEYIVKHKIR
jgi:hypothetical protein